MMIDFTHLPTRKKAYGGANGSKKCVVYENELYMIKFPPPPSINKEMSYTNSCISEYIGCHIFEIIGINAQKTLLGTYSTKRKEKVVCACKDFTSDGRTLQEFASIKNQLIDSERNGYGTELSDICKSIEEQDIFDTERLKEHFWDVFIVDALIGNWDRHNGNWGFLYELSDDTLELAPIYDCGSALYPQADEEKMKAILASENERNMRVFEIPTSALLINNKRINYFKFISSLENEDCNAALKRILPKIDMDKINRMIDDTPYISDLQKSFYKTMLEERKVKILDFSLMLLKRREQMLEPLLSSPIKSKPNIIEPVISETSSVSEKVSQWQCRGKSR